MYSADSAEGDWGIRIQAGGKCMGNQATDITLYKLHAISKLYQLLDPFLVQEVARDIYINWSIWGRNSLSRVDIRTIIPQPTDFGK